MYLANLANKWLCVNNGFNTKKGMESATMQVNMFEAKSDLSKLVALLESKTEESITIARNGKPVACLTLYKPPIKRIGIAEGQVLCSEDFDAYDDDIAEMFGV